MGKAAALNPSALEIEGMGMSVYTKSDSEDTYDVG